MRAREDALADRLRARHRLSKFLRLGRCYRDARAWTNQHRRGYATNALSSGWAQQTFEAYFRALAETAARLESLTMQVLELAQQPAWAPLVQALRCLKGVDTLSAVTLAVETEDQLPDAVEVWHHRGFIDDDASIRSAPDRIGGVQAPAGDHATCNQVQPVFRLKIWSPRPDSNR